MPGMGKPPTEGRKHDMTGQYNKARETRTTTSGTNRAVLRGDQSGLNKRQQYPTEQHQKEPQYGSLRRRSSG
ncbi:hypothetical protein TNCV_2950381 [Trichonephila clavipes]|nr:hypothetical protein TNCV_2950381 [Trichonephila clavipes]